MTILISLAICLIGGLLYLVAGPTQPKLSEIGKLAYFAGLFVTLLRISGEVFKF